MQAELKLRARAEPAGVRGKDKPKQAKKVERKSTKQPVSQGKRNVGAPPVAALESLPSCSKMIVLGVRRAEEEKEEDAWLVDHCELATIPFSGCEIRILEKHMHRVSGFGSIIWDCALVFASYLEWLGKKSFAGKTVLELGSGTGVLGMWFHLYDRHDEEVTKLSLTGVCAASLGARVTATDLPEMIPLLERNASLNEEIYKRKGGSLEAMVLPWGCDPHGEESKDTGGSASRKAPNPDWIFGSEVFYQTQVINPLLITLAHLSNNSTRILLGVRERGGFDYQEFLEAAEKGFVVEEISLSGRPKALCEWAAAMHSSRYSPRILLLRKRADTKPSLYHSP